MDNQTIRYAVGMTALTVLGVYSMYIDGDIGNAMAIAVAGGIGYFVKDWRCGGENDGEKEIDNQAEKGVELDQTLQSMRKGIQGNLGSHEAHSQEPPQVSSEVKGRV